jgi:hypothetical protein
MKLKCKKNNFDFLEYVGFSPYESINENYSPFAKHKHELALTIGQSYEVEIISANGLKEAFCSNDVSLFYSLLVFTDNKKWEEIKINTVLNKTLKNDVKHIGLALQAIFEDPS